MTATYIQSIAHRTFLTIPLFLIIALAIFYPYASEYWEDARNILLAFYIGAFIFLRNTSFEKGATKVYILPALHTWVIGIGLTFVSFFLATGLQLLYNLPMLLRTILY